MGKLSKADAQIIARQICATWNREASKENRKIEAMEAYQAYLCDEWQNVLRALSLEGTALEDLNHHVKRVFYDFILPKFERSKVKLMKLDDAIRIVEFCGLLGHHLPEIEDAVVKIWQDEQR